MRLKRLIAGMLSVAIVVPMMTINVFATGNVSINPTNFPDDNFRSFVSASYDHNGDATLSPLEAEALTKMIIPNLNIESLKGIEFFPNLTELSCYSNRLTSLDLSSNTNLKSVNCYDNQLTDLDVSNLGLLEDLSCGSNQLTTLDVSNNPNLNYLNCTDNQLTSLDVSNNTYLVRFFCSGNPISVLNVDNNINLQRLDCSSTGISTLNISNNTFLQYLFCSDNQLSRLDVSNNIRLTDIYCDNNNISTIDTSDNLSLRVLDCSYNQISSIDVSANTNLNKLYCAGNNLTSLNTSLIERLAVLDCSSNQLNNLDLSNHSKLEILNCSFNQIDALDVNNKSMLRELYCASNPISEIDITNDTSIMFIDVADTDITTIDISNNETLVDRVNTNSFANVNELIDGKEDDEIRFTCVIPHSDYAYTYYYIQSDVYCGTVAISQGQGIILEDGADPVYPIADLPTPTVEPTVVPTEVPTVVPTEVPTSTPTQVPVATSTPSQAPVVTSVPVSTTTAAPTSVPTGITTSAPTSVPTTAPTEPEPETGVAGFAERLYTCALGRASEQAGKDYWTDALRHGTTGADAARGFLFSEEVANANLADADFIGRLYATLMDREPAPEEVEYWVGTIADGGSRESVFAGFIHSTEWANICVTYGILSGGMGVPTIEVDPSDEIIAFATRLYTTCLGREADQAGLEWWAKELANLRVTGSSAAQSYFFSEEFINANVNDREFVNRLYLTFMDRDAASGEFDYWLVEMNHGMSREDVFSGFAYSEEFGNICAEYGIIR